MVCSLCAFARPKTHDSSPSFPATLQKALLAPQSEYSVAGKFRYRDTLRILALETVTGPKAAPYEIQRAGQRVLIDVLKMLLDAAITRTQTVASSDENGDNEKLADELRRELDSGLLRLDTRLTWIVGQKVMM